jgi:hypothetical protein
MTVLSQPTTPSRPRGVSIRVKLVMVGILAASAAEVGFWAVLAPHSFFRSFPMPGHHWVSTAGPYDEHLVRDVGGLYLSLLVISVWAFWRRSAELLRLAGAAWAVFSLPHLVFHLDHLEGLSTFDKIGESGSLALTLALAVLLMVPLRRDDEVGRG